jgi:beta-lactamase class A
MVVTVSCATADDSLKTLRSEVERIAGTLHGDVGASTAILGDKPTSLINGDKRFPFMSTVKTLVVVQALKQVEEGMLPPGTVVGHKTGTEHDYIHDTGFIRLPDGRVMVIAIYIDAVDAPEQREAAIAQIARAAYDYMLYTN